MRYILLLTVALLSACNARMYIDQIPGNGGQPLAPGESASVRFFTADPASNSGLTLTAGASYHLQVPIVSNWIDGQIDADEDGNPLGPEGFANSLMMVDSLSLFKRSNHNRWFELMLYQDGCRRESLVGVSELSFDAETQAWLYQAPCTGDLKFFVNDSQGAYVNNVGYAKIVITRRS